jgi:hypothetical protein
VLVELSVVEQRYHAVMEVLAAGASKTDVADCPGPVPSEASIYRRLVRRGLIEAKTGAGGERTTGAGNGPGRCSCGSWT